MTCEEEEGDSIILWNSPIYFLKNLIKGHKYYRHNPEKKYLPFLSDYL